MTRSVPAVGRENVSATLTVPVPAARVFAVLADPATHAAIDGTGWIQEAVDRAPLTEVRPWRGDPEPMPTGKIEIFSATIDSFGYPDCPGHPVWLEPDEWLSSPAARRFGL